MLSGKTRGDQRAGTFCRLDDQHTDRNAGDQAVAAREIFSARNEAWAALAEQEPFLADRALQLVILRRVDDVDAAGENGGGAAIERGNMSGGVDAARETRGDDETFEAKLGSDLPREFLADGRAVASSHDGHHRPVGKVEHALDEEEGRRRIGLCQRRRVAKLSHRHQFSAGAPCRLKLGFRVGERVDADRVRATAARQDRQGFESGFRSAELIDERAERDGADILAADQAQPAEALPVAQLDMAWRRIIAAASRASARQSGPPRLGGGA